MAMHLASMVHGSGREREAHDHQHRQLQHQHRQPQPSPPQHSAYYPPQQPQPQHHQQQQQPQTQPPRSYSSHAQNLDYAYQRHPQSPPSPPVEEQKPSLPSISMLLSVADGEKANAETAGHSPKSQQHPSPQLRQEQQERQPHQPEVRPEHAQSTHAFGPATVSNPRMTLPPTPPMHPDSIVDGNQSPSTASTHSTTPYFLGQSLNNMEPQLQRQAVPAPPPLKRNSLPQQPSMSPYSTSPYAQSPYASSPGAASTASFYSPEPHYNTVGMYSQRPLPSNFQPANLALPVPTPSGSGSSMWQHHHYIGASSQSAFPQSQDRYICSTCNKAFSRPSSLRIHSHSHTGEKPYKCPQPGCGKAFSVRSNMKRHERGCHAATSTTITTT
ncbi:C2H2 conidiation transcription factor FlbC [Dendryphion nanum]|uniref:C2H2 conidiation transcription factor FlbC n=1 Tax=Dendryphion nanum TaxID=256645 RepID=A0A9P9DD57_9PLEO|nr:C2H2 conidiation transcription factor FlbC [Dendryphion nanum]